MRAARFLGNGRIEIEDAAEQQPPKDELRVRVRACALCGSEMKQWRNGWPVTPGHEIFGTIDAPGHRRHRERVVVYIPVYCGCCEECIAGRSHLCESRTLVGWQRAGGYAETLNVPERCLLPVPDDIDDHLAPLLLDAVGTTAHGIRLAQRVVGEGRALVVGAGPIGLGAIIVLRAMGFGPIDVIDPIAYRANFAQSLGAHATDPAAAANGRYRLVIEASGKDAARQLALEAVGADGAAVQIGESEAWSINETRSVRLKDFFLIRSFYFPLREYSANIELLRTHRADFSRLVDDRRDLDGLSELFAAFAKGERLKPLVCPS
jgi:threonine dehydrogenase-like Zn-dependent dehydrogenase